MLICIWSGEVRVNQGLNKCPQIRILVIGSARTHTRCEQAHRDTMFMDCEGRLEKTLYFKACFASRGLIFPNTVRQHRADRDIEAFPCSWQLSPPPRLMTNPALMPSAWLVQANYTTSLSWVLNGWLDEWGGDKRGVYSKGVQGTSQMMKMNLQIFWQSVIVLPSHMWWLALFFSPCDTQPNK